MAATLTWTEGALLDLEGIAAYIAADSPHFAAVTCDRVVRAVDQLVEFPNSGRVVPEYDAPSVREVICRNYRIVYKLNDRAVAILAVVHGVRLLPDDLRDRGAGNGGREFPARDQ